MKLLNKRTLPQVSRKEPEGALLSVKPTGMISLIGAAKELLDVCSGDCVSFGQDDDGQLFIFPKAPEGFLLRGTSSKKSLIFSHVVLADYILKMVPEKLRGTDVASYRLIIGKVATKHTVDGKNYKGYPVITNSALAMPKKGGEQ
ncbi:hypothetical protein GCM10027275_25170 [Rhabdobacter roseus]|uniref:Uncharacterized protein n=1 Tax=Rhabdobacter roseus TaxID=1655419 RepID=A0A840TRW8_9BACT|nr:hypothetical protein [Rhabdobacter roseus]MBB5284457.1 hypothetical protein [Rhabdobacter roseus]